MDYILNLIEPQLGSRDAASEPHLGLRMIRGRLMMFQAASTFVLTEDFHPLMIERMGKGRRAPVVVVPQRGLGCSSIPQHLIGHRKSYRYLKGVARFDGRRGGVTMTWLWDEEIVLVSGAGVGGGEGK